MRQVTTYAAEIKASVLAKALAPNAPSRVELAKEFNIPYATIYTWTTDMLNKKNVNPVDKPQRPHDKSAQDKLQAVMDTLNKTEVERSAYCRQQGIYTHHLDEWKKQILASLGVINTKQHKAEHRQLINEMKQLKSDLNRKDKALAEVSALLILKKKRTYSGGQRGRLVAEQDKEEAIRLIQEARKAGARLKLACGLLGLDIRTLQRWQAESSLKDKRCGPKTAPANKLTDTERARILEVVNLPDYHNKPPGQIVPCLADRGIYIGSESTIYRVLHAENSVKHRSASRPNTHRKPDELCATKPNQLWSWDITYLLSTIRGNYFYLYLFLDIFSRKIVGFNVFDEQCAEQAASVVSSAYAVENLQAGDITLHSDNGSPMKGSTMLATLRRLGIVPSFSRPSVSDDNPFSESLFKTLKYCPVYPNKPFVSRKEAFFWVTKFVNWYNTIHQHSGINFVTPYARHQGLDKKILSNRTVLYEAAKQKNPSRWSKQIRNWLHVEEVYLNTKRTHRKTA